MCRELNLSYTLNNDDDLSEDIKYLKNVIEKEFSNVIVKKTISTIYFYNKESNILLAKHSLNKKHNNFSIFKSSYLFFALYILEKNKRQDILEIIFTIISKIIDINNVIFDTIIMYDINEKIIEKKKL